MLDVQNKATVRAKTSAQFVHGPLENNGCVFRDNCNTIFEGVEHAPTNNVLVKLDVS
jgi:hypothetical protein